MTLRQSMLLRRGQVVSCSSRRNVSEPSTSLPTILRRAQLGDFVQEGPQHENSFSSDSFLLSNLKRLLPVDLLKGLEPDLTRFGKRVATDIWDLGQECEVNPPYLIPTDAWGRRVDHIVTCSAWKRQKEIAAEEGLISIPYSRVQGEFSRIYQVVKLYMYCPASGLYSCPLAMTDGAASTIERLGLKGSLGEAWEGLTSRDPRLFWTSGQWMTERKGGSDVGQGTETVALHKNDNVYNLHGYKWFSSATDSDMCLTLARISDVNGRVKDGSRGISMFYLKTRRQDGSLNNIQVVKMKNKLGTRQLPTAELLLNRAEAHLVGEPGRGVAGISGMLSITRLHNICSSVSAMRKICSLSRDFATRRTAFGSSLDDHPLHIQTLGRMEVETRGCFILLIDLARLLGLEECGMVSDQESLILRIMTPVAKFYTAKKAVAIVSEGMECFGGQGYIEDTGIPGLLRDTQVLPIWEGTSSVMSLDVARAIKKSNGEVIVALYTQITEILESSKNVNALNSSCDKIEKSLLDITNFLKEQPENLELAARDFALSLAHIYIAALLVQHSLFTRNLSDEVVLQSWCLRNLSNIGEREQYNTSKTDTDRQLVFQLYNKNSNFQPKFVR